MNILPIITRELRAEARRPVNYWLRTFGAAVMTIFFGLLLTNQSNTQSGKAAFALLSLILFLGIWIIVPILTADCISREKRDGTLGLLFLTPLRAIEIILGKGCIHAMRSLTLIIAVLPVMAIPFVLGGITRADVICSLVLDLTALSLSLAAGLLASSLARQWSRALILAELFAGIFALVFLNITMFAIGIRGANLLLGSGRAADLFFFSSRPGFRMGVGPISSSVVSGALALLAGALLIFVAVILFAAIRLKRSWQENVSSPQQIWLQKTFCTPRYWLNTFQRRNQRRLTNNPVGWLQQYSWSSRLSKWGWTFAIIAFISWLIGADFTLLHQGCTVLKYGMLASIAFSSVGSFQREKQNGALELLLVTPLREDQIIWGRLWGIWGQFLPAFSILLLSVIMSPAVSYSWRTETAFQIFPAVRDFVIVPVVGLYFALRIKNFLAAWFMTCLLTLFVPAVVAPTGYRFWSYLVGSSFRVNTSEPEPHFDFVTVLLLALGVWAVTRLFQQLKNRSFVFVNG